ncbi:MAG TPA: ATP-binding protein [Acidimicrobiia bacterium]|jgi:anti-sigma regulatory factor (Ser/Thr protein kinase)|nr:ATP-binding protein [Acidimicrobiia bacterium]
MDRVVELEIPARPEFVGIARMAVGALAGIRPGLAYERIDDLRIVVSEACTSAIEGLDESSILKLRCVDGVKSLEVRIEAPGSAFESAFPINEPDPEADDFRISLIRALVDDADLKSSAEATELCLIMHRNAASDDDGEGDLPA